MRPGGALAAGALHEVAAADHRALPAAQGFLLALIFKYLPIIPLFYIVFVDDKRGKHEMQVRMLKLAGVVALAGSDVFLLYVVGINNLQALLSAR